MTRLAPVAGEAAALCGTPPRLRIRFGGAAWTAPGAVLEGLWQAGDVLLAATTDDVPHEEALHFALLGPPGPEMEHVTLVAPYATGTFRPGGIEGTALWFRFFDTPPWRLEVLVRPARTCRSSAIRWGSRGGSRSGRG
ncbi:hypothetical protein [Jannaschia sp. W003]|uniref:hypothetical protein n=1 Tax=Jannaschia sp. W003 TaxID=2867012 RepID=UPI0021A97498|nr:hypothetical protein [Jannaschia sp. W003]UWQ22632.1 hypothetical protein K3554_06300 [Jannaschia sp. W003]